MEAPVGCQCPVCDAVVAKRDYYEVLGVPRNADPDELKRAYRQAALKHHPDRNPGNHRAEESFKEATEAYQVLSDPEKRMLYDQYGHEGVAGAGGFSGTGFGDIFEGIFEDFFGGTGGGRRAGPERGSDLRVGIEIAFEEAAFGVEKTVTVPREETCQSCKGDGAKPGTSRTRCPSCHGRGHVMAASGFFSISRTCPKCRGQGSFIQHPCDACRGAGRVPVKREVKVKVPAGVENGMRLRVAGEGEAGLRGGHRGDLFVDLSVRRHEFFTREGNDVLYESRVSFVQATLGAEIEVPTLTGRTRLKIPAGTQGGRVFRLNGRGIAALNGRGIGDQQVRLIVETPTHLSDRQKELLKKFEER